MATESLVVCIQLVPLNPEKFYLRLLLLHIPGATCYDGILVDSFREACIKRHLLTDDNEYEGCIGRSFRISNTCLPPFVHTVILQIH